MSATSPVSFRFTPEVKSLLEQAAAQDHRNQTNFLEALIRTHCSKHGIAVPPSAKPSKQPTSKKGQS